jgi:hypothetical protein
MDFSAASAGIALAITSNTTPKLSVMSSGASQSASQLTGAVKKSAFARSAAGS